MSCCAIKQINVPQCVDTIIMPVGLAEGTYTTVLTDKFSNQYNLESEVDSEGNLTIDCTQYPNGLLTKYAGLFNLKVFLGCEKQTITQCDTEYSEVAIKFFGTSGETITSYTVCC